MPLMQVNLPIEATSLPHDVRAFLHEADRRIERFRQERNIPGFVPSDYATAYGVLRELAASDQSPGDLFCEWGSGFGVVACLAAMVGFDACGIEIEAELVEAARQLADDFALPVAFTRGSFIPAGSAALLDLSEGFSWLATEEDRIRDESALGPSDFDVIFAYPWPDEERAVESLFERHARVGAVLATYHGSEELRLRRKTERRGRKPRRSS